MPVCSDRLRHCEGCSTLSLPCTENLLSISGTCLIYVDVYFGGHLVHVYFLLYKKRNVHINFLFVCIFETKFLYILCLKNVLVLNVFKYFMYIVLISCMFDNFYKLVLKSAFIWDVCVAYTYEPPGRPVHSCWVAEEPVWPCSLGAILHVCYHGASEAFIAGTYQSELF